MKTSTLLLVFLFCLLPAGSEAQNSFSKHHYFNQAHRSRIVVNKKYNHIHDSDYMSYELMLGNTNAWNGDVYNQYPSIQFICSYDNNRHFEIGVFSALTYASLAGQNPNGFDLFSSWKIAKKIYVIVDVYTFAANKTILQNDLGYTAKIYNQYTAKLQWNAGTKQTWFLGYSRLNDVTTLQQTFFLEFDYNITKNFPLVLGYTSNSNVLAASVTNFYLGIGFTHVLKDTDKYAIKLSTTFNPLYLDQIHQYWPLTVLAAIEF